MDVTHQANNLSSCSQKFALWTDCNGMNSRQQAFPWCQLISLWLGPNHSHQCETVTNGESNQTRMLWLASACISHGRSPSNIWLCSCVSVFLRFAFDICPLLCFAVAFQLCFPTCITQQRVPGSECARMCRPQPLPSFVFLPPPFLFTAWAHCVSGNNSHTARMVECQCSKKTKRGRKL